MALDRRLIMEGGRISANEMVSMVFLFMIDYTERGLH